MILNYTNKGQAQAQLAFIHSWLKKNREGYNAERWADIDSCADETGTKWYVKLPPDYEVLNGKLKEADKLKVPQGPEKRDKLPDNWRTR